MEEGGGRGARGEGGAGGGSRADTAVDERRKYLAYRVARDKNVIST